MTMEKMKFHTKDGNRSRWWTLIVIFLELAVLLLLIFLIPANLYFSLLFLLSFQIPMLIRRNTGNVRLRMVCRICSAVLFSTGLIVLLACYGRNYYIDSMKVVDNDTVEEDRYQVFEDVSSIAWIDEEPELELEDELPVLNGTSTMFPLYTAVINMIYPDTIPGLNEAGSPFRYTEDPYEELLSGRSDLVFGEAPSADILKKAKKQGVELELIPIAREAFVFFVNSGNEVENLSEAQIRSIYAGEISDWQEVGGAEEPVLAFQQEHNNAAQKRLVKLMGDISAAVPIQEYQLDSENGFQETPAAYLNQKGAIGFTFLHYAQSINIDKGIKLISVNGIFPEEKSILEGRYPLTDSVYCASVKGKTSAHTEELIQWICSPQGKRLIQAAGYYPD